MKIALIGYGKMGRAIERIAIERGHEIVSVIDVDNLDDIGSEQFMKADVAIEFTRPEAAPDNYRRVFGTGVPLISGTTGWGNPESVAEMVNAAGATFMWSSNYSLGVNIFMALTRYAARLMSQFDQYSVSINEIHHIHKLDHPSGTAKTLAETVIAETPGLTGWTEDEAPAAGLMQISHERQGEVPGIHTVMWQSELDEISLTHTAKSRDAFALGVVMAAEWLPGHTGMLDMKQMMGELLG